MSQHNLKNTNYYLTEEQQKLIVNNYALLKGFIFNTIRKKNIPEYLKDEFISDSFLRFCLSAVKYNKKTGFKFSTYAYGGFILSLKNVLTNTKNKIDKINYCGNLLQHKLEYEKDKVLENSILDDFINNAGLNSRDESMIRDYYRKMSKKEMSKKYGLCKEAIRLRVKNILKRLRRKIIEKGLDIKDFYI